MWLVIALLWLLLAGWILWRIFLSRTGFDGGQHLLIHISDAALRGTQWLVGVPDAQHSIKKAHAFKKISGALMRSVNRMAIGASGLATGMSIEDRPIPRPASTATPSQNLWLRIVRSAAAPAAGAALPPVVVYYHGGGWVLGDRDSHMAYCLRLSRASGAVVVIVDYAMAPEWPSPAAVDDAYTALEWVFANAAELRVDAARVVVAGDSAGGNLTAVMTQLARDRRLTAAYAGARLAAQVLVCPATAYKSGTLSVTRHRHGYILTAALLDWFWTHYVRDPAAHARDPRVSPLHAVSLADLPPALVVLAGKDPLYDEGRAYAQRLQEEAVPVQLEDFPSQCHCFFFADQMPDTRRMIRTVADFIKRLPSA